MARQPDVRMGDWLTEYERRYQAAEQAEAGHREGAIARLWELTHIDQEHRLARKRLHQPLTEIEKRHYYVEEVRRYKLITESWKPRGDKDPIQGPMTYDEVRTDPFFKHHRRILARYEDKNMRGQLTPKDRRPDGQYAQALEALHYRQAKSLDNVGESPKVKSR